jgi:hypothetical protein
MALTRNGALRMTAITLPGTRTPSANTFRY